MYCGVTFSTWRGISSSARTRVDGNYGAMIGCSALR
jgi:hypothetical protein